MVLHLVVIHLHSPTHQRRQYITDPTNQHDDLVGSYQPTDRHYQPHSFRQLPYFFSLKGVQQHVSTI